MYTIQAFHNERDKCPAKKTIEMDLNVAKRVLRKLVQSEPLATAHGVIFHFYDRVATAVRGANGKVVIQ